MKPLVTFHEAFNLAIAVLVMFLCHPILVYIVNRSFEGPVRGVGRRSIARGFLPRCFGYLFIALFFTFLGVGASLLPSPRFQTAVRDADVDQVQSSPYQADGITDLDLAGVEATMGAAFIGSVLIICSLRIVVLLHHPNLRWSLIYTTMALSGLSLFTYFQNPKFYRVLFDAVIRSQFPGSLWMIAGGCTMATFLTEVILDRWGERINANVLTASASAGAD